MRRKTSYMALAGLFAALTAIGAYIRVPIPHLPFTLQLFFSCLAGVTLGWRWGALSQIVYVLTGLAGLPVFTGGGGISYVLSPTFGYLIGFIAASALIGYLFERMAFLSFQNAFLASCVAVAVVYLCGVPWMWMAYSLWLGEPKSVYWAIWYGFFTNIGGDILLALLVALSAVRIIPALRVAGLMEK